jgi:tetratricopeptide (TPR) repeat protein
VFLSLAVCAQEKPKEQPKVSEGEQKAIEKINTASGIQAKMQAVNEYMKKFSKSPMRPKVANFVANEILNVADHNQRISLSQAFMSAFNQPGEPELVQPGMIDSLTKTQKFDEAFAEGAKYLAKVPDDVTILTSLAMVGADQVQRQNGKFAPQVTQYSAKAIELIEADKRTERIPANEWGEYKTRWLPSLYQVQGLVAYLSGDKAGARTKMDKAAQLNPQDPFTMMMMGNFADEEYQDLAKQYQASKEGPIKDGIYKQALGKMDMVIDFYARAAAAAEGKPEYKALQEQVQKGLEAYYAFRHNGSTTGMKELVEKYKKK